MPDPWNTKNRGVVWYHRQGDTEGPALITDTACTATYCRFPSWHTDIQSDAGAASWIIEPPYRERDSLAHGNYERRGTQTNANYISLATFFAPAAACCTPAFSPAFSATMRAIFASASSPYLSNTLV